MTVIVFRTANGQEFSVPENRLRHLGSPMEEIRDSVPRHFRSAMDWQRVFAEGLEKDGVPDSYAPALMARQAAKTFKGDWPRPAATQRHSSGEVLDGYAAALAQRRKGA